MTKVKRLKAKDLKVGATYCNRGAGTKRRKVLGIGNEYRPVNWYGYSTPPDEPGVEFQDTWTQEVERLYLSSFISWVGSEVETWESGEGKP
jgi:hypothetical protein